MNRRTLLANGLATVGTVTTTAGGLWYYSHYEANRLVVEKIRLTIPGLNRPWKIAQLTDIHWDGHGTVSWDLVEQAVATINQAQVDLVALTGDFVTAEPDPIHYLAPALGKLQAKQGIYAVLGNHDHARVWSAGVITTALQKANIQVLENTWTQLDGLALAGAGDLWHGPHEPNRIFRSLRGRQPTVLLSHNPDSFWPLGQERVDLQLSGHSHGGQIHLGPFRPAAWQDLFRLTRQLPDWVKLLPRAPILQSDSWEGRYGQGSNTLYVSRGLGRFGRISLGCPPEVTILELLPAPQ